MCSTTNALKGKVKKNTYSKIISYLGHSILYVEDSIILKFIS